MNDYTTRRRAQVASLALLVGLLGLACQSQPGVPRAAQQQPAVSNPQPAGQASGAAEPVRIREIANAFFPASIVVKGGTTLRLRIENQDAVNHNLMAPGEIGLKSSEQDPVTTTDVVWAVPSRPGTYKAVCVYHPGMEISITIQ